VIGLKTRSLLCLVPALATVAFSCSRQESPRPDILLLVVDTLRADHLGSYGSSLEITPNLDRFAARSAVFGNAIAQGPNTINSSASILTSTYVSEHGFTTYKLAVSGEHQTLAEILAASGYETFAVSTNPHVTARNGLAQGFDTFIDNTVWTDTDAHQVDQIFLDWLDGREDERPFFAMLWYIEPHVPYSPPQNKVDEYVQAAHRALVGERTKVPGFKDLSEEEKQVTKALYRGEISYYDDQFGELLAALEDREILDESLIVFTSDHGESFWERSGVDGRPIVGHGISMFREEIAVPLMMKLPFDQAAGTFDQLVSSIDIVPTLADYLDLEPTLARPRGTSLMALLEERELNPAAGFAVSELLTDFRGSINIKLKSYENDQGKIIITYKYRGESFDPPLVQLFDVPNGEQEVLDTAEGAAAVKNRLLRDFRRWQLALEPIAPENVPSGPGDNELVKRLEALGYLN
jgi:arylsulfatase A-like enzyme